MNTVWTSTSVAEAAQGLPRTWVTLSAAQQRAMFGTVVFGRKAIARSSNGIRWRIRKGRDGNGMPRYLDSFESYGDIADRLNCLPEGRLG